MMLWLVLLLLFPALCNSQVGLNQANHSRALAVGDFQELNNLVKDAVVRLPDARVDTGSITLDLRDIQCSQFSIDDVSITNTRQDNVVRVQLDVQGLDMSCTMDYVYSFLFTRRGSADVNGSAQASIVASFALPDKENIFLPSAPTVDLCNPEVNIIEVEFRGDISAIVLDTIKGMLRRKVESEAEQRICEELDKLTTTHVSEMFERMHKNLARYPPDMAFDPLLSEDTLNITGNVKLVDFQNKDASVGKWFDRILDEAVGYASKQVDESGRPVEEGGDLNLNFLIRENFLQDGGVFVLDGLDMELYQAHDSLTYTSLVLNAVNIVGLDTLKAFEPLEYIGKYTFQNKLSWEVLRVELDITVDIKPSTSDDSILVNPASERVVKQRVRIGFGVKDLGAVASILLAIDETYLGALPLGAFLEMANLKHCALSSLYLTDLSGLTVELSDIEPPRLDGFVSPGIDRIVSRSVDAFFLIYEGALQDAAPSFFQIAVREYLNTKVLAKYLAPEKDPSNIPLPTSKNEFVDFRGLLLLPNVSAAVGVEPYGNMVSSALSSFRAHFTAKDKDGSPKINSFIREAGFRSNKFSGDNSTLYVGNLLNKVFNLEYAGLQARIETKIHEVWLENLDSFGYPLKILEPIESEAHVLNNSASIGVDGNPVRLAARVAVGLTDDAKLNLQNELEIMVDISAASVVLPLLLQIKENRLFSVPLRDTFNPICWITSVVLPSLEGNGVRLMDHAFQVERFDLNVSCWSCTSPKFDDMVNFLYSPSGNRNATVEFMNYALVLFKSDYVQVPLKRFLLVTSKQCQLASYAVSPSGSSEDQGFEKVHRNTKAVYFTVANVFTVVCLIAVFIALKWRVVRYSRKWRQSLSPGAMSCLREIENEEERKAAELDETTQSMFLSTQLPRRVRYLVPVVLVLNIGLFLGGHIGILSKINIEGQLAGEGFSVDNFISFSFIGATARTYRNGGSELAVLAWIFVAIWPYVKLVISLVLWFIPPRMVGVLRRGSILLVLDVFAKLSIVDIFMMLVAVASLLVYIGGPDDALMADGAYFSMKLVVVPGGGFYCIIIAQQISRVISHFLLDCQSYIVTMGPREEKCRNLHADRTDDQVESIPENNGVQVSSNKNQVQCIDETCDCESDNSASDSELDVSAAVHDDNLSGDGLFRRFRSRSSKPGGTLALILVSCSVLVLVVIGCSLGPSVSLDTKSVWGMLGSGLTFEEAVREYGVFRIVSLLLLQLRFVLESSRDYIGLGFLLLLLIISSTIFPLMNAVSFLNQWRRKRIDQKNPSETEIANSNKMKTCHTLLVTIGVFPFKTAHKSLRHCLDRFRTRARTNGYVRTELFLLPGFRIKAWQHLEVYVLAFVIAAWQLGAIAAYAIHVYCFLLEQLYDLLVYLGLQEMTYTHCFRVQASSSSTILILIGAFLALLASFLIQAISQYTKMMASARKLLKEHDAAIDSGNLSGTESTCNRNRQWLEERCQSGETQVSEDSSCYIEEEKP